jgi:hypothetical protein
MGKSKSKSAQTTAQTARLASDNLLRKIDDLREKNIGQHIPLPQVRIKIPIPISCHLNLMIWYIARRSG